MDRPRRSRRLLLRTVVLGGLLAGHAAAAEPTTTAEASPTDAASPAPAPAVVGLHGPCEPAPWIWESDSESAIEEAARQPGPPNRGRPVVCVHLDAGERVLEGTKAASEHW